MSLSLDPSARQLTNPGRVIDPHLVIRREPCACGADVVQLAGEDPATAVRRHQRTEPHWIWRQLLEAEV